MDCGVYFEVQSSLAHWIFVAGDILYAKLTEWLGMHFDSIKEVSRQCYSVLDLLIKAHIAYPEGLSLTRRRTAKILRIRMGPMHS